LKNKKNLYEKLISQIYRLLNTYRSKVFSLQYWFKNDFVEATNETALGYKYVPIDYQGGLGSITSADYEAILLENLSNYLRKSAVSSNLRTSFNTRFLAPRNIFGPQDSKIDLIDLIENPYEYQSFDFSELELDVKRYLLIKEKEKKLSIKRSNDPIFDREQELKYRTDDAFKQLSIKIDNIFLNDISDQQLVLQNGSLTSQIIPNPEVDPTFLMLAIAKQVDFNKGVLKKRLVSNTGFLPPDIKFFDTSQLPVHIESLIKNYNRFFDNNEEKYLQNLTSNSQFLFLFNTIHEVEYLFYDRGTEFNIKNEQWKPFDIEIFKAPRVDSVLCRLKLYTNSFLDINYFDDIKMPVYNKYFIISRSDYTNIKIPTAINSFNGLYDKLEGYLENKLAGRRRVIVPPELLANLNIKPFASPLLNDFLGKKFTKQPPLAKVLNKLNQVEGLLEKNNTKNINFSNKQPDTSIKTNNTAFSNNIVLNNNLNVDIKQEKIKTFNDFKKSIKDKNSKR